MITCFVRYTLDLAKLDSFAEYGRLWISLINRLGGIHHGYFAPSLDPEAKSHGRFSFPGIGSEGPTNAGIAVFSFPDWVTYERYRAEAGSHEECVQATKIATETRCFTSYERTFLTPVTALAEFEDPELLARFETQQLSRDQWVHRTHVRVGYLYMRRHAYAEAFDRMRAGVKALNRAHGTLDTPTGGYHETLTGAWLRLIEATIRQQGPGADSRDFCDNQPQLLSKKALRFFYSADRIMSREARAMFVDPDLTPFPRGQEA